MAIFDETTQASPEAVDPAVARWLATSFCLLILLAPLVDLGARIAGGQAGVFADLFRQAPTAESLTAWEDALEEGSALGRAARPWAQWAMTSGLRRGNEKVVVGRGGWLFYRPSLDHQVGPAVDTADAEGDPRAAIRAFRNDLAAWGAELWLLPVPGKETIEPDRLWPGATPAPNAGEAALWQRLRADGVRVVDPTDVLTAQRPRAYLPLDTHWTPDAMAAVAGLLAERLTGAAPAALGEGEPVTHRGDIHAMLDLPAVCPLFAPTTVRRPAVTPPAAAESPVLLLGDSFTNIYSDPALGWGGGAGLGETLASLLGTGVDVIAQNDGGVNGTRAALARQPARLAGKRVVVWQFATRDLSNKAGEWEIIPIRPPSEVMR